MNLSAFYRIASFCCAATIGVLLLGTISRRLVVADQAWMYLAIGGTIGLLIGAIDPVSRLIPSLKIPIAMALFAGIAVVFALVGLIVAKTAIAGCSLNWTGVVLGALLITLIGVFLRELTDASHA